jgi:Aldo/keto reductase family
LAEKCARSVAPLRGDRRIRNEESASRRAEDAVEAVTPDARFIDQFGALVNAREERLIAGIGISNVSHAHLLRAVEVTDIVCAQNSYSLADRSSRWLLDDCLARGIAFVPFRPPGSPKTQRDVILCNPVVTGIAARYDATLAQVALAWLPAIAPNVLLISGTSGRRHLAENLAAASLALEEDEVTSLAEASAEAESSLACAPFRDAITDMSSAVLNVLEVEADAVIAAPPEVPDRLAILVDADARSTDRCGRTDGAVHRGLQASCYIDGRSPIPAPRLPEHSLIGRLLTRRRGCCTDWRHGGE